MYKLDVIGSDGGYRVAWCDDDEGIVIVNKRPYNFHWFATRESAQEALDALYEYADGDVGVLEGLYDYADDICRIEHKIDMAIDKGIDDDVLTEYEDFIYDSINDQFGVDAYLSLARAWGWDERDVEFYEGD